MKMKLYSGPCNVRHLPSKTTMPLYVSYLNLLCGVHTRAHCLFLYKLLNFLLRVSGVLIVLYGCEVKVIIGTV